MKKRAPRRLKAKPRPAADFLGKSKKRARNVIGLAIGERFGRPTDDIPPKRPNLRELSRAISGNPPLFEYVGRSTGGEDVELTDRHLRRLRIWPGKTDIIKFRAPPRIRNRKRGMD